MDAILPIAAFTTFLIANAKISANAMVNRLVCRGLVLRE
jgi:hypothetical protein